MDATTERATRRGFLGGLLGGLGVLAATLLRPETVVEAAAGDPVRAGKSNTAGTASTILATNAVGDAFRVVQAGKGPGIAGQTTLATGESIAIRGTAKSTSGQGVNGRATAKTGATRGVVGVTDSTTGQGVQGWATATSGASIGVYGQSDSPEGQGAQGWVKATSGDTIGVYGVVASTDGIGVQGHATAMTGTTIGVMGTADSSGAYGVVGFANGASGRTTAVWGLVTSPDGWAGRFTSETGNGVYISVPAGKAGLNVAAGTKNAVVLTGDGARLLYAEEATEVLFADHGFGRLVNGSAEVRIDPVFAETLDASRPYHVFLQPYGDVELWVAERGADGFTVRGRGVARDAGFSYRIVGTRAGYGGHRLERAPWADGDANLARGVRASGRADRGTGWRLPRAIARHRG